MDTYFAENVTIETPSDPLVREMEVRIELTPTSELADDAFVSSIRAGDRFELPEIRWDYDSYRLREEAKPALSLVAEFLQNRPGIEVELRSHCDARGSDAYNQRLSEQRANSAAQYLLDLGVPESQVFPVGVGEGELRNECSNGVPCSEAKHQENRRTNSSSFEPRTPRTDPFVATPTIQTKKGAQSPLFCGVELRLNQAKCGPG